MKPQRIQLSRRAGFRLQSASLALNGLPAVKVDRSTVWGNPWPVGERGPLDRIALDAEGAVGFFRAMFSDEEMRAAAAYPYSEEIRERLRGKNLACWCKPGAFCHADVLLEIANSPDAVSGEP